MTAAYRIPDNLVFLILGMVIGYVIFGRCGDPLAAASMPVPERDGEQGQHGNVVEFGERRKAG